MWDIRGGSGFDSRALQGKKVVGLERGPLSLVSTTEELLGRKSRGSGLEIREYGRRDSSRRSRGKLALTTPTSDGRSVRIVRLRTEWNVCSKIVRPRSFGGLPLTSCHLSKCQEKVKVRITEITQVVSSCRPP
jgi:hypothetical protein